MRMLIFPLLLILLGISKDKKFRNTINTALLVILSMLVGYFIVYIITPNELEYHLNTSLRRLLLQLLPSGFFIFFLKVSTSHFRSRRQSPWFWDFTMVLLTERISLSPQPRVRWIVRYSLHRDSTESHPRILFRPSVEHRGRILDPVGGSWEIERKTRCGESCHQRNVRSSGESLPWTLYHILCGKIG